MLRLNGVLAGPVIANGFACGHDTLGQRGFTDHLSRPDLIEQFVFGDDAVVMLDEIDQQIEDFGF